MRWSRWGILITAILMGSGMVLSAVVSHSRVHHISENLVRGQAQLVIEAVRQGLRDLGMPPTSAKLERLLTHLQEQGVRYLALVPRDGPFEVGTALGGPPSVELLPHGMEPETVLTEVGSRIRVVVRVPPPPPQAAPPPGAPPLNGEPPSPPPREAGGFQRGPPPGGSPPPPAPANQPPPNRRRDLPPTIVEFEPLMAQELEAGSRRSLLISSIVALALLTGAAIAFRWLKGREALEAKLARERHLAVLGEMSAVLAHELRNPLASLKGHAQLLAEALPEGRSRTKAERVVKEALRLEDLTSSLLAFVRTGTIQRQETDPVAVVRAAAEEVDPRLIELDAQGAPASWSLDAARMQQVLSNLLRNAVQASPAGSSVFARIATEEQALLYEVRDVGSGIPPGQENVIFEPFHTGRPLGNGLGLAVARRVVELHGGSIRASNHPEGGALFRVRIPFAA
ncbi:ATP-binding protein [Hyalangium minutum]|uniref:histidine kinase n=1 Tax=Hyalangium minutum TaxID=394096 RepID=A0A085WCF4_9BACT|nr:ATP-binding protein [Hyalangium minutum]KFE65367.1 Sensor protein [Hyalangium minutum]